MYTTVGHYYWFALRPVMSLANFKLPIFARGTRVNFTQQYGKNRQRCPKNKFYYAVWQLLLYYCREFLSKILSVYSTFCHLVLGILITIFSFLQVFEDICTLSLYFIYLYK